MATAEESPMEEETPPQPEATPPQSQETPPQPEETPSQPQVTELTTDFIQYVLDGATEVLCQSLDPSKVVRRLISKHQLTGDDVREINSFARYEQRVEKLIEILKMREPQAYIDFVNALFEFREELFHHVREIESHYTSEARSKKRPSSGSYTTAGGSSKKSSTSGGAKSSSGGESSSQQSASGGNNYGNQYFNQQANMNYHQFNVRATQINVKGKMVNIEGNQTIVGGNVYNFPGNVHIYKDKAYGDRPYKKK